MKTCMLCIMVLFSVFFVNEAFADPLPTLVIGTSVTGTSFSGDGSGLTNVNAATLGGNNSSYFSPASHNHDSRYSLLGHNHNSSYVQIGASGSITSGMLSTGAVSLSNIGQNGCSGDQIMRWNGSAWICSGDFRGYANVVIVAKYGGDYTDPWAAMEAYEGWCDLPSATNPCLLKIMPGVYDIGTFSVWMQNYIDIEGSGELVTKILGHIDSASSGVVHGAAAELRFLTIENTGGGSHATAIYNDRSASYPTSNPRITHVTAYAHDGTDYSTAIYNTNNSNPVMTNVTATASGGTECYGVFNQSSSGSMTNVTAKADSGTTNYGVRNQNITSSMPPMTMTNVTATASGGTEDNFGVANDTAKTTMTNVTALATLGTKGNTGIVNGGSTVTMNNIIATAQWGGFPGQTPAHLQWSCQPRLHSDHDKRYSHRYGISDIFIRCLQLVCWNSRDQPFSAQRVSEYYL
jgi:hypothetical protein